MNPLLTQMIGVDARSNCHGLFQVSIRKAIELIARFFPEADANSKKSFGLVGRRPQSGAEEASDSAIIIRVEAGLRKDDELPQKKRK